MNNNIKIDRIKNYQKNLYPYYSQLSKEGQLCDPYSYLYHAQLAHTLGDTELVLSALKKFDLENQNLDKTSNTHNELYTYFHLMPLYWTLEYEYMDYLDIDVNLKYGIHDLEKIISNLDLTESWRDSNIFLGIGCMAERYTKIFGYKNNIINQILDKVEAYYDVETGLITGSSKKNIINSIAGTFHFVPLLRLKQRPFKNSELLFQTLKSFVYEDGLLARPSGYVCLEYDFAIILKYIYETNPELLNYTWNKNPIVHRLHASIANAQNLDGGWGDTLDIEFHTANELLKVIMNYAKNRCMGSSVWEFKKIVRYAMLPNRRVHANSIKANASLPKNSNVFATWFRLMTLNTLEQKSIKNFALPGLGSV